MSIKSVCVFCGSSDGRSSNHGRLATELGGELARNGLRVVYGGAKVGLMGKVADAAIAVGGQVVGVMPRPLQRYEVAHLGLTELEWTDDLRLRKQRMADLSDAFVVLPGGIGTLEEALEVLNLRMLGAHEKPIVLLDGDGFFTPLMRLLDGVTEAGFAHAPLRELIRVVHRTEDVVPTLLRTAPPVNVVRAEVRP